MPARRFLQELSLLFCRRNSLRGMGKQDNKFMDNSKQAPHLTDFFMISRKTRIKNSYGSKNSDPISCERLNQVKEESILHVKANENR